MDYAALTDGELAELETFRKGEVMPLIASREFRTARRIIEDRLRGETRHYPREYLLSELCDLLVREGEDDEVTAVIHQMIEHSPDDPLNRARLSAWHLAKSGDALARPESLLTALTSIDAAIAKARTFQRHSLRQCLNHRCRVAVAMKRWDLLEESLREILENRREPGIQFEGDFLRKLPEGAVDEAVMANYKSLLARQAQARDEKGRSSPAD